MKKYRAFFTILFTAFGIAALGISASASAATLGLTLGYPQIDSEVAGICAYDTGTSTLTLTATPTIVTFDSGQTNISFVDGVASVTISANINSAGTLVGGTFSLNGQITDFNNSEFFADPILTGNIVAYGIDPPGTTDLVDFRIQPTGGTLLSRFASNDQIGVQVTLEGSTFNGSFASNWGCTTDKFLMGPIPPLVQESCVVTLTKTANPTTIGPIIRPPGHDKFGDSDSDDDNNGYGYSRDDDDPSIICGCRGKVSELTLRYNGSQPASVMVTRNAPYSVTLYQGTVQPGDQFTVPASSYGPNGFSGTLGSSVEIAVNGGTAVDIETSGAKDIGPGLVAGDFEVMSGKSRKLHKPLCPIPQNGCPANQQVTYTYTLTNSATGSALTGLTLDDDKLGNILTGGALASGQSATFTKTACLAHTTTNTATAMGLLPSGAHCAPPAASATVTLLMPPPDCNGHPHDCDPEDVPPPPPPSHGGCSSGYWKGHTDKWGKSFKQGNKFSAIFQVDSAGNRSVSDTLNIDGGGAKALGREAVAALLNASDPTVNYFYTAAQVKSMVQDAYTTKDYTTTSDLFKQYNSASCPFGN